MGYWISETRDGALVDVGWQVAGFNFCLTGTPHALMRCDDGLTLGGSHDNAIYLISRRGRRRFR